MTLADKSSDETNDTQEPWKYHTGFDIWGVRSHAHASAHGWNIGDMQKKARLVWLRKLQDVRQIARLKQQRSLSFTFCKTQRSYEKIINICYFVGSVVKIVLSEAATGGILYKKVFLKFAKLTGKYKCQSLFFNKFAGSATSLLIVLTWKSLKIVHRKLMNFFKVLHKENHKSACKRQALQ